MWESGTTRRRHACCCAPYGLPSAAHSSQRTNGDRTGSPHTATLEVAPGREEDSPRRPAGTRFARTAINSATSTTLCTIPLHVIRTVRHDCKLPRSPGRAGGGDGGAHTVGELGKKLSPSKRQSYRICKYIHELASGWKVLFREKETLMKRSW
jgi:hypothetical protein